MLSQTRPYPGAPTPDGQLAWSPLCDLRNCAPQMVGRAVAQFEAGAIEPWLADHLAAHGLTPDGPEVKAAGVAFRAALAKTFDEPDVRLDAALKASGFHDAPPAVQLVLTAKVGQLAVGMAVWAWKEGRYLEDGDAGYRAALDDLLAGGDRCWRPGPLDRLARWFRRLRRRPTAAESP